eukprot:scaffold2510_cov215-Alexandrium_tamarense.AAC.4
MSTVSGANANINIVPALTLPSSSRGLEASDVTSTVVDPNLLRSAFDEHTEGGDSLIIHGRKVHLRDLKKVIERDDRYEEVTAEQIKRVKAMHDSFYNGAVMNFNYNTLLLVASVLAGLGLVTNSTATIIASMLVSPIMGPVVAIAYGWSIWDRKMVRLAWTNELLSLLFCVFIGAVIGAITGTTSLVDNWPTDEMAVRCTMSNFYVGIPIAFFSGLGVAVSLLDDQTNSLVGVAISASLLPPAVNCGVVWVAYAFYSAGFFDEHDHFTWKEYRKFGWTSLGLTLVNIAMIWISSMIMFRLKEVLPIEKKVFWSDLGIARKIYKGKALMAEVPSVPAEETKTGTGEATRDDDRDEGSEAVKV